MKRFLLVICLTALCLGLNAWAADQNADFSGTWVLDTEKSDPFPIPVRDLGAQTGGGGMGGGMAGGMGGGMGGGMAGGMGGGMGGGMAGGMGGPPMGGGGRGFGGIAPKLEGAALVIQQTDSEFRIISGTIINGQKNMTEETYKLDGKEKVQELQIPDTEDIIKMTTKVELKKNKFKIRSKSQSPRTTNDVKKELSLSDDGKELTIKTKTTSQTGHMVMQTEQKQVYYKQ
jgi:hypothetical protein